MLLQEATSTVGGVPLLGVLVVPPECMVVEAEVWELVEPEEHLVVAVDRVVQPH